jgi:putative ABC transport system permease protein
MSYYVEKSTASRRLPAVLLSVFAGMALLLAAVGIYGVISFLVTRRTHELGIRMALGASGGRVLRLVLGEGIRLLLAGLATGLAGAFAVTRLLAHLLFGVGATDPVTFTAVATGLAAVALAACLIPARRASRVDPAVALRHE